MGCCASDTTADDSRGKEEDDYDAFQLQYDDPQQQQQQLSAMNRTHTGGSTNTRGEATSGGGQLANSNTNQNPENLEWTPPSGTPRATPVEDSGRVPGTPRTLYSPTDQSFYAPSFAASNASIAFSATNTNNVTANDVNRYVKHVNGAQSVGGDSMGFSFLGGDGGSTTGGSRGSSGAGAGGELRRCTSTTDVEVLESVKRSELYANFVVTNKMILLAARRIVPVVRRETRPSRGKKAVIMVHHKELSMGGAGAGMEGSILSIGALPPSTPTQPVVHWDPDTGSRSVSPGMSPSHKSSYVDLASEDGTPLRRPSGLVSPGGGSVPGSHGEGASSNTNKSFGADPRGGELAVLNLGEQEQPQVPTYHLEAYSAMDIECDRKVFKPKAKTFNNLVSWDLLAVPGATEILNKGNTLFKFMCRTVKNFTDEDRAMLQPLVDTTGYKDELAENGVPPIDFSDKETFGLHTVIVVRNQYMLPGLKLENLTPGFLTSDEYHLRCQPGPPKVEPYDPAVPDTCRCTKTIIRFVFKVTIMLKCHELKGPEIAQKLEYIDGITPAKVIVYERTKRNKATTDGTITCKTFLLYYPVTGGILCTHLTVVVNKTVPRVVAPVVNSFGTSGAKEAAETAELTRAYLIEKFGDSRLEMQQ